MDNAYLFKGRKEFDDFLAASSIQCKKKYLDSRAFRRYKRYKDLNVLKIQMSIQCNCCEQELGLKRKAETEEIVSLLAMG